MGLGWAGLGNDNVRAMASVYNPRRQRMHAMCPSGRGYSHHP